MNTFSQCTGGIDILWKSKALKILKEKKLDFELYFDEDNTVENSMKISSLPTTLIIDKNSKIIYKKIGYVQNDKLDQLKMVILAVLKASD